MKKKESLYFCLMLVIAFFIILVTQITLKAEEKIYIQQDKPLAGISLYLE